tara:strand:+ start:36902 stop:37333 length:432 start_codon:yes stop_codon:yes gene_type:complete
MAQDYNYYVTRLRVDKLDLQKEILDQVELCAQVMAEAHALRWEAERQKEICAETEALVFLRVKEDLSKKRTVDEIKATVTTDPQVIADKKRYIDLKEGHDKWSILADGYKNRGYALRELVEIYNQEFTSDPATIAEARLSMKS